MAGHGSITAPAAFPFALAALIVLLQALVIALTELGVAPALSSLIVGGVVAIIAFALIYKGIHDLKGSNLAPRRTVDSLRQDAHMVKEQAEWVRRYNTIYGFEVGPGGAARRSARRWRRRRGGTDPGCDSRAAGARPAVRTGCGLHPHQ